VNFPWLFCAGGGAALCALLWAEARARPLVRAVAKTAASLGFLDLALALGVRDGYGRLVATGLALSVAGDVCLLAKARGAFLAGLGLFLLAHLAYAAAFLPLSAPSGGALVALLAAAGAVLRWLWPHLGEMRLPVVLYAAAITAMLWLALGVARPAVAAGALLFYASDLFVARGAFVLPGKWNQLLGWPLYYAGQYLIALSVG